MDSKKKSSLTKAIESLLTLIPGILNLVYEVLELAYLKLRLVKRGVFTIILLSFIMAVLLASLWFCLMAMLGYYLHTLQMNLPLSVVIILILNTMLIVIIGYLVRHHQKNLSFNLTTKQCQRLLK